MQFKKIFWICIGSISLVLGSIGVLIPVLPTVPFLIIASFCYARSSQKLHQWFISTKLYRDNLKDYAEGRGMTKVAKIRIMITITILMSVGMFFMYRKDLTIPCTILGVIWIFHVLYFCFGVKTLKSSNDLP